MIKVGDFNSIAKISKSFFIAITSFYIIEVDYKTLLVGVVNKLYIIEFCIYNIKNRDKLSHNINKFIII